MDWNAFWIKTLGTDDYLKVSEVTRDFYFHFFIQAHEARSQERLLEIQRDWSGLLDDNSPETIRVLTDPSLSSDERRVAYQSFIRMTGIIEKPSRYNSRDWKVTDLVYEPDPVRRLWAINTYYQFAKESLDDKCWQGYDSRLCGVDIFCCMVGILDNGALSDALANNRYVLYSCQGDVNRLITFVYALHGEAWKLNRERIPSVLRNGKKYLREHLPEGYSYDDMKARYPIFFQWLRWKCRSISEGRD